MTPRRIFLILLVAVAAAAFVAARTVEKLLFALSMLSESRQALIAETTHSLTYVVARDRWTIFDLPARHGRVRLVTNAALFRGGPGSLGDEVLYALRYRITGSGDAPSVDRLYHFRSRRQDSEDDGSPLFFLEGEVAPADGRVAVLDLFGLGGAPKELRLRLEEAPDSVAEVVCRVYYEHVLSPAQQHFYWERLSNASRRQVARRNVYTPDLLSEEEKLRYSRFEWTALAPRGVVGRDYRLRVLYRRWEEDDSPELSEAPPSGLRVRPGARGMVPLPEGEHLVTLIFERATAEGGPIPASVTWYGREPGSVREESFRILGQERELVRWLEGGLLEVAAAADITVRAALGPERVDITPEGRYLRGYLADGGAPVEFDVHHVGGQPTPFRIDLRALHEPREDAAAEPFQSLAVNELTARARYEVLDGSGTPLLAGSLEGPRAKSIYDRLAGAAPGAFVAEPLRSYFLLPAPAAKLRVMSPAPVLVNAWNRLPWSPKSVRVPEDYYEYNRAESDERGWFLVRPRNHESMYRLGKTRLVSLQYSPPRPRLDLVRGSYDWERYFPDGDWTARALLVPREVETREERALGSITYTEVPPGREVAIKVVSPDGSGLVSIKGIYVVERPAAEELRIDIDNRRRFDETLAVPGGQFVLEPIRAGEHILAMRAGDGIRVFLSNVLSEDGETYLRRPAVDIGSGDLRFRCVKEDPGDESLLAHLYL